MPGSPQLAILCSVLRRLGFLFCVGLLTGLVTAPSRAAEPPQTAVALPFSNLTAKESLDWVGESLSWALFEAFSGDLPLVVGPDERDEVLKQMNVRKFAPLTDATVIEIAANLNSAYVVSGSFEAPPVAPGAAAAIKLKAKLLNARKLHLIKTFEISGPVAELSSMEVRLAWRILAQLRPAPIAGDAGEQEYLRTHPPVRLDALERYVRGLMASGYDQKAKLFTAAARLQPNYSNANYQLGLLSYGRRDYRNAAQWLAQVDSGDAHLHDALFRLGLARYRGGDYRRAADAFRQLSAATPLSEVFNNLAVAQMASGDTEAQSNFRKAMELDPADTDYHFNAGYDLLRRGDFDGSTHEFEQVLQRRPDDSQAAEMLRRARAKEAVHPGELRAEPLERLKTDYDETVWRQLKAILDPAGAR